MLVTAQDYHWDDVKAFQAVASAGSIRGGAATMDIALNTVRYRIKRLEEQIGAQLFRRLKSGVELTEAGVQMKQRAIAMGEAAAAQGGAPQDILVKPRQLTIACSEAVGSLWLTPQLGTLRKSLPGLTLGLHCDFDLTRDFGQIADIGIGFTIPSNEDLIVSRLGTLHFVCYASREYIRKNGMPTSLEDIRNHDFIEQDAPGVKSSMLDYMIGRGDNERFIGLRTNSSSALYFSVADGAGIAAMPTYFSHIAPKLQAIDLNSRLRFDMYYFFHRDARNSPSVRIAIDWLKAAFDPVKYPYFADDFVHPDDCRPAIDEAGVVQLFPKSADYS